MFEMEIDARSNFSETGHRTNENRGVEIFRPFRTPRPAN